MVIGIFGESCTGKSTIADELSAKLNAQVFTGKDYIKLAKNEADARRKFAEFLEANAADGDVIIYVISEREHLALLPEASVRVLVCAELDVIKERFARRMNGNLPAPVAAMLEKRHGSFDSERHDLRVDNADGSVDGICGEIMRFCGF